MYGYYGRTASPPPLPPSSTTTTAAAGSGAWASTPAPHHSVENDQAAGSASVDEAPPAEAGGEGGGARPTGASADGAEDFVPDFGIPEGVVVPSTVRQHMMMVGTARTAVRSPQVQYSPDHIVYCTHNFRSL